MFPVPIILLLGKLISLIPFSWRIFLSRTLSIFFIPFAKIPVQPCTVTLRYKRCVSRLENGVWRFAQNLPVTKRLHIVHREYLEAARQEKRGIILVSIHHHYLQLFCRWINQFDPSLQPYIIANFIPEKRVALHIKAVCLCNHFFSGRLLQVGRDMRRAVHLLRSGKTLILLQDHLSSDASPIPFLGHMVRNPLGSIRLAEMTDSLIVPFVTTNTIATPFNKKKWAIHFWPQIDPREKQAMPQLISCLENMIHTYPEVWQNWSSLKSRI